MQRFLFLLVFACVGTANLTFGQATKEAQRQWQWVKGHSGHQIQEIADKAARKIADAGRVDLEMLEEVVLNIGVTEI